MDRATADHATSGNLQGSTAGCGSPYRAETDFVRHTGDEIDQRAPDRERAGGDGLRLQFTAVEGESNAPACYSPVPMVDESAK